MLDVVVFIGGCLFVLFGVEIAGRRIVHDQSMPEIIEHYFGEKVADTLERPITELVVAPKHWFDSSDEP